MANLIRASIPIDSLFAIHGQRENDVSAAFATGLAYSPVLLLNVMQDLQITSARPVDQISVHIQTARWAQGITDIEIRSAERCIVVFEAKLNSDLPSLRQMAKYDAVLRDARVPDKLLVALTNADSRFTSKPPQWRALHTPVELRSWRWARRHVRAAQKAEKSLRARFILNELLKFLEAFVGFERVYSNMVYVVSLGDGHPPRWKVSWIDVVEKHSKYFYPFDSKSWPAPSNYMGFRYRGRLQSIHHVDEINIVDDIREHFPGAKRGPVWGRHYLLSLGPAMRPAKEVRLGPSVQRSARIRCMLDTLLTANTLTDALDTTRARIRHDEQEQEAAA
jgi:hypothetical protein